MAAAGRPRGAHPHDLHELEFFGSPSDRRGRARYLGRCGPVGLEAQARSHGISTDITGTCCWPSCRSASPKSPWTCRRGMVTLVVRLESADVSDAGIQELDRLELYLPNRGRITYRQCSHPRLRLGSVA